MSHALHDGIDVRLLHCVPGTICRSRIVERHAARPNPAVCSNKYAQAGSDGASIRILIERPAAVVHRFAHIDDQGGAQLVSPHIA